MSIFARRLPKTVNPGTSTAFSLPPQIEYHMDEEKVTKEAKWIRVKHITKKLKIKATPFSITPSERQEIVTKKEEQIMLKKRQSHRVSW